MYICMVVSESIFVYVCMYDEYLPFDAIEVVCLCGGFKGADVLEQAGDQNARVRLTVRAVNHRQIALIQIIPTYIHNKEKYI